MEWIRAKKLLPPATPGSLQKTETESDLFAVYDLQAQEGYVGFYCHDEEGWWTIDGSKRINPTHWLAGALPKPPEDGSERFKKELIRFCVKNELRVAHAVDFYYEVMVGLDLTAGSAASEEIKKTLTAMRSQKEGSCGMSHETIDEWIAAL